MNVTFCYWPGYSWGRTIGESAKAIYEELEENSEDPTVLEAVQRNLEVVNQKLAILAESDPLRKEHLELELADLHRDLGHERAAKRLHSRLATDAKEQTIRSKARKMLSKKSKPGRLPVPPAFKQSQ